MNLGITIARKGTSFTVLTMPEVPFNKQRRAFRALRRDLVKDGKPTYDEIQLWSSSGGRVKRVKLRADIVPLPVKVAPVVAPVVVKTKVAAPAAPKPAAPKLPPPPKVPVAKSKGRAAHK